MKITMIIITIHMYKKTGVILSRYEDA